MSTEESKETTKEPVATDDAAAKSTTDKPTEGDGAGGTNEDDNAAPAAVDDHVKRIYVSNLAWEVTSDDLSEHMKGAGFEVASANVLTSPDGRSKGCGIIEFATAEMASEAVKKMNDTELKGRHIFVREDRGDRRSGGGGGGGGGGYSGGGGRSYDRGGYNDRGGYGGRGGRGGRSSFGGRRSAPFTSSEGAKDRRVYVGNLSWEVAWQDLKDHMVQAGDVVRAEVIKDASGRSKGCGIVEFANDDGAKNAIATLTDTELKGRRIFVREDREINKQSGGGGGGGRFGGGPGRGENRRFDNLRS